MLKWFRKYNKYIMAVGASLLMVAFLMPATLQSCGRGPRGYVLGTIEPGGDKITLIDQQQAGSDLEALGRIFSTVDRTLPRFAGLAREDQNVVGWLLMKHDAAAMGLSAGPTQVSNLLDSLGVDTEAKLLRLTRNVRTTHDRLYQLLADWLVIQQYTELVTGRAHLPVDERLSEYRQLFQQYGMYLDQLSKAETPQQQYQWQLAMQMFASQVQKLAERRGTPRVSEPILRRYLVDQLTTISIEAVEVTPDQYLADVADPDEQRLAELFEQHKSDLPGEGKPFGLGYRFVDRVKIEYLTIPFDRLLAATSVDEIKAIEYYDQHPAEFTYTPEPPADKPDQTGKKGDEDAEAPTPPPAPKPVLSPYPDVRDRIIDQLKREAADELAQRITNAARSKISADMRRLKRDQGYIVVSDGWKPMALADVAKRIQTDFAILPDVTRRDDRWLSIDELRQLKGIGTSSLILPRRRASFADYVASARELLPEDKDPLLTQRLQVKTPSHAVQAFDGTRYLFRLIDAEPAHDPESLGQVRDQVQKDARRLAAYQRLLDETETWRKKLDKSESLADLAEELGTTLIKPQPFARRQADYRTGQLGVPSIDPVGQNEEFVDALFDAADRAAAAGPIATLPVAHRSAAISCATRTALYLVRIEDRQPVKLSEYEHLAAMPNVAEGAASAITTDAVADTISIETIANRIGFVWKEKN